MGKSIKIGKKLIGEGKPCFIIAEAGVNHNGDIRIALRMVDAAVKAGADAIKFQTFRSEDVVTHEAETASYAKKNIGIDLKQIDMLKKIELNYNDFTDLKKYCDKKKIMFLSTPHSFDAIDFLDNLVPAFKFGSGDLTNLPALKYAAKKGKPIILGTGMATLQEVKDALEVVKQPGNENVVALHCTTNYPCPLKEVNMNAMRIMQKELDCLVGYSDHTMGITVPIMAATLGAVVIEKHFTLDKNLPGPDHKASLEPGELKKMVCKIRNVEIALGNPVKKPTKSEKKIMEIIRKSIIAKNEIKKGILIKQDMLIIKRPGTGLQPSEIKKIIGKKAKRTIKKDEILKESMVE